MALTVARSLLVLSRSTLGSITTSSQASCVASLVAMDIIPYQQDKPEYKEMRVLERMTEPDRVVTFRVCWEDDAHNIRVNRGSCSATMQLAPTRAAFDFTHL